MPKLNALHTLKQDTVAAVFPKVNLSVVIDKLFVVNEFSPEPEKLYQPRAMPDWYTPPFNA